ncbi:formyltransferase family protein [Flavobacterium paronense]|uniref:Formyltransferase family protein n=1 Tax=Flavobacterium paronense TaxID=1392775 RepID=A0ABV5GAP3_9FLAO|nr:formyltransferase family protein [Flavobacterium paronense]MDN3676666.1 formyltransferase family protein [Flavobacterium paronense]
MNRIVIAGFGQPVLDLITNFSHTFEIVGVFLDYERRSKFPFFYSELESKSIPVLTLDNLNSLEVDAIILINFNKIINIHEINTPLLLNIHMGLLPVYRGNNANAWSILNGDRNVGYTLHQVTTELDGGAIYYKFEYLIKESETYFAAKNAITYDLKNNLPKIIQSIFDGKIEPVSQEGEEFIYASKVIAEDGILENWNYTTTEIINRNIIFSKPLGTGLKMKYKNDLIEINKLRTIPKYKKATGFAGAVVLKTDNGAVWIKTKDTAIALEEIIINNKIIKPADIFKIGDRL